MEVVRAVQIFDEGFVSPNDRPQRSVKSLLSSVLSFYAQRQFDGLVDDDGDMLLFQYGIYDWGLGPLFEVDLTRQFIEVERDDDDEVLSQFRLTCFFEPTAELKALGSDDKLCRDKSELGAFSVWVMAHPVLAAVDGAERLRTEVRWELV